MTSPTSAAYLKEANSDPHLRVIVPRCAFRVLASSVYLHNVSFSPESRHRFDLYRSYLCAADRCKQQHIDECR